MDDPNKRIDIDDLPRAEEELSDEEAKNVQGGLTKVGHGTLSLGNVAPGNTVGGPLGSDVSNPSRKMGDGSV